MHVHVHVLELLLISEKYSFSCEPRCGLAGPVHHVLCVVSSSNLAGSHCAYPQKDGQAELTWLASHILRWFTNPQTHPSTTRAQQRATTMIESNALPLSETTNQAKPPLNRQY